MRYKWEKRWSFSDSLYCGPYVISKIKSPTEGWHLEKLHPNGQTQMHLGTFNRLDSAKIVAERCMDREDADYDD